MKKSKDELLAIRKKHLLPTASHYYKDPLYLVKAKGEYVFDDEGREYLDAIGGIVCIGAGHNHPKIKKILKEMLDNDEIQHTSTLYLNHHLHDLAEAIVKVAPVGLDRVSFTNSGSEANELAFMAARQASSETSVMNLQLSYHGGTAATLAQCGHHNWRFKSQPVNAAVSVPAPYCYRCPWKAEPKSCSLECAKAVDDTIKTSTNGQIAAMIVEPVMGVGGFITPPKEYFTEITAVVHNYGGRYISDEVQTGSGRCGGEFFLSKELGIDVDMVTTAKSLGNGAPIGCVVMKSDIADKMNGKTYFNTFGGDPYQTAQAKAAMEIIEEEGLIENARLRGKQIMDALLAMKPRFKMVGDVRGRGLLIGIELVKDPKTKDYATKEALEFMELCKERGLLVGKGGLYGNVIRIAPPLMISEAFTNRMLKIIEDVLAVLHR